MSESKEITAEADCFDCKGTGVQKSDPEGVGYFCETCNGGGKIIIKYTPFTGRKRRDDIGIVLKRKDMTAITHGLKSTFVPYEEFLKGEKPVLRRPPS